jgi:pimeloyl-ACP methyl ester carboxylesterase
MDNLDLHVTDTGTGTPILWIHGYPLSSAVFAPQLAIAGARHIMPDLPGFGRSTPPTDEMSIEDYAILCKRLLDHLHVTQAVVAGFSMGGYIALALARLAPESVRALILIDTRETADSDEARKGRYETIEKVENQGTKAVVETMLPKMLSKGAPSSLVHEVRAIMDASSAEGVVAALQAMAERSDSTSLLPELRMPVLIVVGENDTITPPADAERVAKAIAGAKLVTIPNAAHLSNFERPEEFNAAVEEFLRTSGSGR